MKILTGKEALVALANGDDVEFQNFSGIWEEAVALTVGEVLSGELKLRLKPLTMELGGITFTKPLTREDVVEGQEIFVVYPSWIVHTEFTSLSMKLVECVRYGFVQADKENAELQLQAIGKLLGRAIDYPLTVEGSFKPEKKRSTKAKKTKDDTDQARVQADTENTIADDVIVQDAFVLAAPETVDAAQERDAVIAEFTAQINACTSVDSVLELRPVFMSHQVLEREHHQHLCKLTEDKLLELDPEQYAPKVEEQPEEVEVDPAIAKFIESIDKCHSDYELKGLERNLESNKNKLADATYQDLSNRIAAKRESFFDNKKSGVTQTESSTGNLSIAELKRLQEEAEKLVENKTNADEEYQNLLTNLLDRASKANTPAEANTLVRYTKTWTEEQRKPLLDAIHKRLVQLNDANEKPSLAVRIERAADLTELDALEIDVSACDPVIQPRLMELIEKRRFELNPPIVSNGAA
ncbi:hypothetical protein [Acinetobacter sp. HR7]|uniref:hypothetical protein n=1 Tax=Acinetobacter sp. HR7 TaxID=1509403 RepID=UPI0005364969|nr:hypothetical protein [Acinetobacter sp. HR7]KGT48406.1 hypothetical protein GW12_05570 [Acinetobacter sp. HR7]